MSTTTPTSPVTTPPTAAHNVVNDVSEAIDMRVRAKMARAWSGISPISLALAYTDWALHLAASPGRTLALVPPSRGAKRELEQRRSVGAGPHSSPTVAATGPSWAARGRNGLTRRGPPRGALGPGHAYRPALCRPAVARMAVARLRHRHQRLGSLVARCQRFARYARPQPRTNAFLRPQGTRRSCRHHRQLVALHPEPCDRVGDRAATA